MSDRRATMVAILSLVLAACSAGAESTRSARTSPGGSAESVAPSAATPSLIAAATPVASVAQTEESTPLPAPTAAPTPVATGRKLAANSLAVVATDDLVLRDEPRTEQSPADLKPWLQRGVELYVLRGPARANGYTWYEVMPLSDEYPSYGWVASASKTGEPWIEPLVGAPDCPDVPSTVAGLADLAYGLRLACFSGVPTTVTALLATCFKDSVDAGHDPAMFDGFYDEQSEMPMLLSDPQADPCSEDNEGGLLDLMVDPGLASSGALQVGAVLRVTGIFDHPEAARCQWFSFIEGGPEPDPEYCRPQFVVTGIE